MTRLLSAIQQLEAEGAMAAPFTPGAAPELVVPQKRAAREGRATPIDAYAPTSDSGPHKALRRAPADLFPDAHSAEAYRGIARQLARRLTSTNVRSIGVVTADANGDATEIATLLAAALADVQQVTVLSVGAERGASDMRIDESRLATVGHVLSGAASWEDAIHSTSVIGLSTARLLRDDKHIHERQPLRGLWKAAPERFDCIVIGIGMICRSGSTGLAASCDATCIAIPFGRISRKSGKAMASRLRGAGAMLAGCILL